MIASLLRRKKRPLQPAGSIPAGQRVYAIGDIHGRLDLLDELLNAIERDEAGNANQPSTLIFLGDLIDRGPQSAAVVQRLLSLTQNRAPGATRFLKGNHEEVLLTALGGDAEALRFFTRIGGRETILSYGVDAALYAELDYPQLLEIFQSRVPVGHIDFLSGFEDLIVIGDYVFVHAGVRPGIPLAAQKPTDLRWIRETFLSFNGGFEKIVVHGHTVTADVDQTTYRIGLDTGAFATGKLTAMAFERDQRWTLQTGARD